MRHRLPTAVLAAFFLAACADQPTEPLAPEVQIPDPLFSITSVFDNQGTGEELEESKTFFPASTNDLNFKKEVPSREGQDAPYVLHHETGVGEITLEFVNNTNSLAFFEVRIDGETVGTDPHPIVNTAFAHPTTGEVALIDDVVHPGVCLDGRGDPVCPPGPILETLQAESLVEIRLALGGERDWDFDWTAFHVPSTADARDACKDGGWEELGFSNQGRCIQHMNTGR
jgi:hypothetical protein